MGVKTNGCCGSHLPFFPTAELAGVICYRLSAWHGKKEP
jgi:hypothetical protein